MRKQLIFVMALALVGAACGGNGGGTNDGAGTTSTGGQGEGATLTVYSGRGEELVGSLFEQFEEVSGINVEVRYGETAELAATILEEGDNSPADVFFAQDAGALGALAKEKRFSELPEDLLVPVPEAFRSTEGVWVGTSGRARTVVYNTEALSEDDLPASILDFTDEKWKDKIGWAPTNGSFQAFVTALRKTRGDDVARDWLEDIKANDAQVYAKNSAIVEAVAGGEVEVGFVNHYYLYRFLAENPGGPVANYFLPGGDPGALVNVAGVGVLDTAEHRDAALEFVQFLLSERAQTYFAGAQEDDGYEYPVIEGVPAPEGLPALASIEQPDVDLSDLSDLQGTLDLLQEVGLV